MVNYNFLCRMNAKQMHPLVLFQTYLMFTLSCERYEPAIALWCMHILYTTSESTVRHEYGPAWLSTWRQTSYTHSLTHSGSTLHRRENTIDAYKKKMLFLCSPRMGLV